MIHSKKLKPLFKKLAAMDKKRGSIEDFVENEYIDERGVAIIDVRLSSADIIFSPYSDKKVLNHHLMNYIDSQADPISPEKPLIINFIVDDVSRIDQEFIRKAIKRYYWLSYKSMTSDLRRINITSLLFLLIGIGITIIYQTLARLEIDVFANEIILIASWVFIWESVTRFTFNRRANNLNVLMKDKWRLRLLDSLVKKIWKRWVKILTKGLIN